MRNILKLILLIFFLSHICLLSQKEADNWYFGYKNGLSFKKNDSCPNPPCPIYDGQLTSYEGFSSSSDSKGDFLFYTEGERIWNKIHEVMNNGDSLFGHYSATQSSLIIPFPGKKNLFYLLNVDGVDVSLNYCGKKGFNYSIIDISLNLGLGKVMNKNINLLPDCTEKLTAVQNRYCNSYWVIVHEWESTAFRSYLVSDNDISAPVISNAGSVQGNNDSCNKCLNKIGYMKISPLGNKIAVAVYCDAFVEIFDFDNITGKISNCIKIKDDFFKSIYGIEFSPNGKYLYIYNGYDMSHDCDVTGIYQYDISIKSVKEILNSRYKINDECRSSAGMQLGHDGKLYIAYWGENRIDVLENPNKKFPECRFVENKYILKYPTYGGFPNFISSLFVENKVTLPDTIVKIGSEVALPLHLILNCSCVENNPTYQFTAEIEFDATLFYPYSNPGIIGNTIVDGQRILTMQGEFKAESQETVIAEIPGLVLFGDSSKTPLKINKFELLNSNIDIKTQDGSLEIYGICSPDISHIKLSTPLKVEIMPNPVDNKLTINIKSQEAGAHKIIIYNTQGFVQQELPLSGDLLNRDISIDVSNFANGLYFVKVQSPFYSELRKFVVLH